MKNLFSAILSLACAMILFAAPVHAATITIVDETGTGVGGAEVTIGTKANDPFNGNVVRTDGSGRFTTPTAWTTALPVTVMHSGYVLTTFQNVTAQNHSLRISKADGQTTLNVEGLTSGFGPLKEDGKIDFGLVFPAIPVNNLVRFDMASVVSPVMHKITAMGRDIEIPSNITLPPQDESYIFTIHFDKQNYLMPLRQTGVYTMTALHGQFPFQKVVNEVRNGKSLIETLNNFSFLQTGIKTVSVTKSISNENLDVNHFQFKEQASITAPTFAKNQVMLTVALAEDNGIWKPTDLKKFNSGETRKLVTNSTLGATKFLSVLTSQTSLTGADVLTKALYNLGGGVFEFEPFTTASPMNYQQLSLAVSTQPNFLSLVAAPAVKGQTVQVTPPPMVTGLTDAGTMLILSEIERSSANSNFEKRTRIWEHVSPTWISSFTLPEMLPATSSSKEYRWEVLFMAKDGSGKITHVTRNAIAL